MSGKYLFITLLCTLSLSLSACVSTEEPIAEQPTVTEEPTAAPTQAPPTATPIPEPTSTPIPPTAKPEAAESGEEDVAEIITDTIAAEEVIPESVVGELTFPSQGNDHIAFGSRSPIEYNTTPPSSGPHYSNIIQWDIYDKPIPYELLVHNLEDGGVIVYYQCEEPCPELVQQLSDAITPYLEYGWHVVVAPNEPYESSEGSQFGHLDIGAKIAVVAWQKVLKLDEFDSDAILLFLEAYEGIDHHKRG